VRAFVGPKLFVMPAPAASHNQIGGFRLSTEVAALVADLGDPDRELRWRAAYALGVEQIPAGWGRSVEPPWTRRL
jgi:hypothetical protein